MKSLERKSTSIIEDEAHLDHEALQKLREIGARASEDTFVKNLLTRFLEGTPERLAALQTAAAESDCDALEFQAHTLKSSCGYVGARVMANLCQTLESMGRGGDVQDAEPLIGELLDSFALVRPRLERLLTGIGEGSQESPGTLSPRSLPE